MAFSSTISPSNLHNTSLSLNTITNYKEEDKDQSSNYFLSSKPPIYNECNCIPQTRHYDIKMSKRTRKPLNLEGEADQCAANSCSLERENTRKGTHQEEEIEEIEEEKSFKKVDDEEQEDDHKSLKELIEGRSSLGKHFTQEEKQLQVVVKQHDERLDGLKLGKMARFLSRLIKIKKKKSVLRLQM